MRRNLSELTQCGAGGPIGWLQYSPSFHEAPAPPSGQLLSKSEPDTPGLTPTMGPSWGGTCLVGPGTPMLSGQAPAVPAITRPQVCARRGARAQYLGHQGRGWGGGGLHGDRSRGKAICARDGRSETTHWDTPQKRRNLTRASSLVNSTVPASGAWFWSHAGLCKTSPLGDAAGGHPGPPCAVFATSRDSPAVS